MRNFGRATLSEFLGDYVAYRNLAPCDPRIPGLEQVGPRIGLAAGRIPRKSEADYGAVVVHFLNAARQLEVPGRRIERLIFVGDTRLLDATAYAHLCAAGGWPGLAFIGAEDSQPVNVQHAQAANGAPLYLANRWSLLEAFDRYCTTQGLQIDESAAVVLDLDKTALGARGRNAHVIDAARVQAVQDTVAGLLGAAFDVEAFQRAYDPLNRPEFHPFTGDNQDYLAYICLILGSGLFTLDQVVSEVRSGRLASFDQFIETVQMRRDELPAQLSAIHTEIYSGVQAGDPTPFKSFRRREYLTTVQRFGCLPDETPVERLLADEITITQEVRAMALEWRRRGALLFGLSDKPDEAAVPTTELAAQGCKPLHRTATHAVGE